MKKLLIATLVVFGFSGVSFAQDTAVEKSLTAYMCGSSGNINPKNGTIFDASSEMGVEYAQNFANAQWLTVSTTIAICGISEAGLTKQTDGTWKNEHRSWAGITGYGAIKLGFDKYASIAVNSFGRIDLAAFYSLALPANQKVTFKSTLNIYPISSPLYAIGGKNWVAGQATGIGANGSYKHSASPHVIDSFDIRVAYGIKFHPRWDFGSEVRFRMNGAGVAHDEGETGTTVARVKADSGEAFKNSFNIRWNNTISYSDPNGFGAWFQFRYQPERLASSFHKSRIDKISLHGGITYSYDLSIL